MRRLMVAIVLLTACAHPPPRFVQPVIEMASAPHLDDLLPVTQQTGNLGTLPPSSKARVTMFFMRR